MQELQRRSLFTRSGMTRVVDRIEEVFAPRMSEGQHRAVGDALWWAWHEEEAPSV